MFGSYYQGVSQLIDLNISDRFDTSDDIWIYFQEYTSHYVSEYASDDIWL